jgi:hypothetical protein
VVPPLTQYPAYLPTYAVLPAGTPGVPQPGYPQMPAAAPPPMSDAEIKAKQRELLAWGTVGVLLGATANCVVTALAFKSYKNSKSVWKPALWSGVGSLAIGGTLLWVLTQSMSQTVGPRAGAAFIGAKLAV